MDDVIFGPGHKNIATMKDRTTAPARVETGQVRMVRVGGSVAHGVRTRLRPMGCDKVRAVCRVSGAARIGLPL